MASQAQLKKRLKVLMNKPENQICSDCPERQPRWASLIVPPPGSPPGSLPLGAFCCLECSGSHRRLGVHISFVRSVNLDSWKEREVLAMENGGNKKVNAIFEARLATSGARKPTTGANGQTRERYIRDKYERRKFYDGSVMEGYEDEESSEEESSEEEARAPPRPAKKVVRAQPSEVARRRVESRKARLSASQSFSESTTRAPAPPKRAIKQPKAPVRAPASAPAPTVDLLDFSADFSKAPSAAPVEKSASAEAAAAPAAALDLFANMAVSDNGAGTKNPGNSEEEAAKKKEEQARASNEQILAMFNTPTPQQTGFGMGGMNGTMQNNGMMMGGGGGMMPQQTGMNTMNPAMMQQPQQNMMMQNNNMMMGGTAGGVMPQQTGMNTMNPGMMQQQQQQQNMMMMQANSFGNPNMMMQNNMGNMGMQQHQMKPMAQPNGNMMPQDSFGFPQMPMGSGPPIGTTSQGMPNQQGEMKMAQGTAPVPAENDPFASFSANAFRS